MKNFFVALRNRNSVFLLSLLVAVAAPWSKVLFTGHTGPSFLFYFVALWLPLISLTFASFKGLRSAGMTAVIFLVVLAMVYFNYPANPAMNFQRQFVHDGSMLMLVGFVISTILQLRSAGARGVYPPNRTAAM